MEMTSYDLDTSAGAVILGEFGKTTFEYTQDMGFHQVFTVHRRIKILDKEELEQGDFLISLYESNSGREEKLSGLKAFTFNMENGKVAKYKLERKNVFKEKFDNPITIGESEQTERIKKLHKSSDVIIEIRNKLNSLKEDLVSDQEELAIQIKYLEDKPVTNDPGRRKYDKFVLSVK